MGWARFVHPENSSSCNGGDWLSNCVWWRFGLVVYGSVIFYWGPSHPPSYPKQGQGWGRLGVNTLMYS